MLIGTRNAERGRAAAGASGARYVQIDFTNDDSVAAAASDVQAHEGHIDAQAPPYSPLVPISCMLTPR